jgi:hypothetical protein
MRSELLRPKLEIKNAIDIRSGVMRSIPGVRTGTPHFDWGFKPHSVDYGKGRAISADELKRRAEDAVINELNKSYAVVPVGSRLQS